MNIERRIELIQARKLELKTLADLVNTKVLIYSERDTFAAAIHYQKLVELNNEYLKIDDDLSQLLKEVPPPILDEHIFI